MIKSETTSINYAFNPKTKHKTVYNITIFIKLHTPSYRNILKKHVFIFSGVKIDLLLKKEKEIRKHRELAT